MNLKSLLCVLMLGSLAVTKEVEAAPLSDPNHILEQSDSFLGQPNFTDAFRANDEFAMAFEDCTVFISQQCSTVRRSARVSLSPALDTAWLTYENGEVGSIARSSWEIQNGNSLRVFVANAISYGASIEILAAEMVSQSVLVNGATRSVNVLRVHFRAHSTVSTVEHIVDLTRDLRGVGQIVQRQELTDRPIKERKTLRLTSAVLNNFEVLTLGHRFNLN